MLALLDDCWNLHLRLQEFYESYRSHKGDNMYWEAPSTVATSAHNLHSELFPTILRFRDRQSSVILPLYWAILAMLWSGLHSLYSGLEGIGLHDQIQTGACPGGLSLLACRSRWLEMIRNVCRSVQANLLDLELATLSLMMDPPRICVSLGIVIDLMKGRLECETERTWALQARREIGERYVRILRCEE